MGQFQVFFEPWRCLLELKVLQRGLHSKRCSPHLSFYVRFTHRFIPRQLLIPFLHTWTTHANSDFKIKQPFSISSTPSRENRRSNQFWKHGWTFSKNTFWKIYWNGQSQRWADDSMENKSVDIKALHVQIYSFLCIS